MSGAAPDSRQYLFELVKVLKTLLSGTGPSLPELAQWLADHWTGDPDFCNELAMFFANPGIDFEIRAELFDRLYQVGPGPADDLLMTLLAQGKHWDQQMTGVLVMIDHLSGRLRRQVLTLAGDGAGAMAKSNARARMGFI